MNKYIDSEKLIAEIESLTSQKEKQLKSFNAEDYTCSVASSIDCKLYGNMEVLSIIKSLQQEQPDKYKTALEKAREWMPNVNQGGHAILIDIFPELGEGLDPRYGGRKQEQPEVDLEKIIGQTYHDGSVTDTSNMDHVDYENIARYFYELGLNARKNE